MPEEHDCVRLTQVVIDEGEIFPAGTAGTVVSVYNRGEAFAVEVVDHRKVPAIIVVPASHLERVEL
jgi:ribosomal protein L21E